MRNDTRNKVAPVFASIAAMTCETEKERARLRVVVRRTIRALAA